MLASTIRKSILYINIFKLPFNLLLSTYYLLNQVRKVWNNKFVYFFVRCYYYGQESCSLLLSG